MELLNTMLPIVRSAFRRTVRGAVITEPKLAVSPGPLGSLGVQFEAVVQLPPASTFHCASRPDVATVSVTKPPDSPNVYALPAAGLLTDSEPMPEPRIEPAYCTRL